MKSLMLLGVYPLAGGRLLSCVDQMKVLVEVVLAGHIAPKQLPIG